MPGKKRTPFRKELHYRRIAALYSDGYTQDEIAEALNVSQPTISNDFKVLESRWKTSTLLDFNHAKGIELAEIAEIRREAWEAWERSIGESRTVTTETKSITVEVGGDNLPLPAVETKTTTKVEKLVGAKQYLDTVGWTVEQRLKILGAYAATKSELTGKDGGPVETAATVSVYMPDNGRG